MCPRAKGSETEAHIEPGFTHGAVTLVIIGAEPEVPRVFAAWMNCRERSVADLQGIRRALSGETWSWLRFDHIAVGLARMKKEIFRHFAVEAGLVLYCLCWRPLSKVVIPR